MVEGQTIDVQAGREDGAHALLERIGEANRARWLPLIERIFDEFDRPGEVIRIDRIDLDLGRFTEAGIGAVDARLEIALRAALRGAVPPPAVFPGQAATAAGEGVERLGVGAALVEALEHWLLHGTWPYGAALDPDIAPAGLLARLIEDEPQGLVAMLRRRGRSEPLLRRLVRQIPEALLERLLHRLEPESAVWILGHMAETRAAHGAAPLVEATPEALARTVWEIVLRDVLRRAGLRANRRSFVARLIGDLASAAGLTFAALVRQIWSGLRAVPRPAAGADTLLSILSEIGEAAALAVRYEQAAGAGVRADLLRLTAGASGPDPAADTGDSLGRLAAWLAEGGATAPERTASDFPPAAALEAAEAEDPIGTRRLVRRFARADTGRLLDRLGAAAEPAQAARWLLPPGAAAEAAAFLRQARCGAEEGALLLGLAAAMPASAPPASLVQLWVTALAESRGERPERLAERLGRLASAAGGDDKRLLAPLLPFPRRSGANRADRLRAARRRRAIGLLRVLLHGRPMSFAASVSDGLSEAGEALAALAAGGLGAERLPLDAGALPGDPEAALRRLDRASLRSLIALLAPRSGAARARLRRLVSGERNVPGLARIAARLLAGRAIGTPIGSDLAAPPEPLAAALQMVEATLTRGGAALDDSGFRTAAGLLVRRRPARLPAMLAADSGRGGAAAARLLAHPDGIRLLFAGLPERARGEAAALARRLAGPGGLGARTLAASLPAAVGAAAGRRNEDPVAAWVGRLWRLATAAERRQLVRLLGRGARAAPAAAERPGALPAPGRSARRRQADSKAWLSARAGPGPGKPPTRLKSGPSVRQLAAIARGPTSTPPGRPATAPVSRGRGTPPPRPSEPGSPDGLRAIVGQGAASPAAARAALRSSAVSRRLARNGSRGLFARLLLAARPAEARALLDAADLAAAAIRANGGSLAAADLREAMLHAAARSGPGRAVEALLERLLILHVAGRDREAVARRLLNRARADGRVALVTAVEEWLYDSAPRPGIQRRPPAGAGAGEPEPRRESKLGEPAPFPEGRAIAVANAGLVLAGAYLPQLFARLGLAAAGADRRLGWTSEEAPDRAVHLLQFLADERCDAPEPALALNKLLCGLDPARPALPFIVITDDERATCESLLEAMLDNWPMLKGSSMAALRETFLQRQGRLVRGESGWRLQVERKVLDIMLDGLPWSFAMIFNAWMPEPLGVDW